MIQFEDEDLLIYDKPSGVLTELSSFRKLLPDKPELHLVHRLDKETSGLIILAKTVRAREALEKLFYERRVEKLYLAHVQGVVKEKEGCIDLPLLKRKKSAKEVVVEVSKQGSPAVTYFRTLERGKKSSLLVCQPMTGRTHQIRVHLAARGYPILGDYLYGKKGTFKRLMLHAYKLRFQHPFKETLVEVTSEPGADFTNGVSARSS